MVTIVSASEFASHWRLENFTGRWLLLIADVALSHVAVWIFLLWLSLEQRLSQFLLVSIHDVSVLILLPAVDPRLSLWLEGLGELLLNHYFCCFTFQEGARWMDWSWLRVWGWVLFHLGSVVVAVAQHLLSLLLLS